MEPFRFQNRAGIEKGDFVKMSVSPARGAHFQRFGPPKSIQKSMKNRDVTKKGDFVKMSVSHALGTDIKRFKPPRSNKKSIEDR